MKVILIDDNRSFLESAKRFLSLHSDFEVVAAAGSAPEGIEFARRLRPDVVITDIAMPQMNGLEVASILKRLPEAPAVVILTLYDTPEYRDAASAAGADAFIAKSDLISKLPAVLRSLVSNQLPGQPHSPSEPKEKPMKHILVVDDSKTMRRMVIASLQPLKPAVFHEAGNGLEALEQLALHPIDVMTLDLNMPDMHGMEVLRFVRAHPVFKNLPVVILSTKGDSVSQTEAMEAGASLYLTKPFSPTHLCNRVMEFLQNKQETP